MIDIRRDRCFARESLPIAEVVPVRADYGVRVASFTVLARSLALFCSMTSLFCSMIASSCAMTDLFNLLDQPNFERAMFGCSAKRQAHRCASPRLRELTMIGLFPLRTRPTASPLCRQAARADIARSNSEATIRPSLLDDTT
jgi:hypothetical protein